MKKIINSEIVINKSKKEVWDFITDFYTYHLWNTYFLGIRTKEVEINKVGQKIRGFFMSESHGPLMYNAFITEYEPEKIISWRGRIIIPIGCFGKHTFLLEEIGDNSTKLIVKKEFEGFTVGLMKKRYFERLQEGFDSLCINAKERIENPEKFAKKEEDKEEKNSVTSENINDNCNCNSDNSSDHSCHCDCNCNSDNN